MDTPLPKDGDIADTHARLGALSVHLQAGLVGREALVEALITGLLTDGHLLVEGAPGLAKTRAVKLLADAIDADFARIQCTPDLMPADLTGTPVYRPQDGSFEFVKGPVFSTLVLVDEVNRAPPKVQSALLEAMAERQVTSGGETRLLPDPFMVVATQNPIEHEGTFPLPEAQLDRFLLHVVVEMPDAEAERAILDLVEEETAGAAQAAGPSLALDEVRAARAATRAIHVSPALKDFIVRLVMATRPVTGLEEVVGEIAHPVSPRGSLALMAAAKARAYLAGRDHALPEDVADLAEDALAHRIVLTWRAAAEGQTPRAIVRRILDRVQPI